MSLHFRMVIFVLLAFAMCLLPAVLAFFLLPRTTNLYQFFGVVGIAGAIAMIAKVQRQLVESDEEYPDD